MQCRDSYNQKNIMKLFKRIKVSLSSSIEGLLNSVENHEAATEAVIKESQEHLAKVRVRLQRLQKQQESLETRIEEACKKQEVWQERAAANAANDKEKALGCLRRKKANEEQVKKLEAELKNLKQVIDKVEATSNTLSNKVSEMKHKKDVLAARDYQAKAISETQGICDEGSDLTGVFDRWEEKVLTNEICNEDEVEDIDHLDREFEKADSDAELSAELDALIQSQNKENA